MRMLSGVRKHLQCWLLLAGDQQNKGTVQVVVCKLQHTLCHFIIQISFAAEAAGIKMYYYHQVITHFLFLAASFYFQVFAIQVQFCRVQADL